MIKISIITVTYNSGKTIADTIKSVLAQSYPNIEHIIIDGKSADGTVDIINKYKPLYKGRLKYISEKDNGIYDAMNKGISMATGDVAGILNSDDYFTANDIIETVASQFNDAGLDAVYGDIHFVKSENQNKTVRYYSSAKFRPFWLRFGFMPAHPSFYVRKQILDKAGLYKTDYKIGSDYEMMVRLFLVYKIRAKYIHRDFVTMRTGGASTKNFKSKITLIDEDVRACRENGIYTNRLFICSKFVYKIFEYRIL